MNKKTIAIALLFGSVLFIPGVILAKDPMATNPYQRRQHNQTDRIKAGVKTGELTRYEARKLKREQRQIRKYRQQATRDGRVTGHEKRTIARLQNKANSHIYNARHNRQRQYHQGHTYYRYKDGCRDRHRYYRNTTSCQQNCRHNDRHCPLVSGLFFSGTWIEPGGFFSFSTGGKW